MTPEQTRARAERLIPIIAEVRARALALEQQYSNTTHAIDPDYQVSERNLLHYLALRQVDAHQHKRRSMLRKLSVSELV